MKRTHLHPSSQPPRAFTLVELLVVLGIIAILAGILVPTLAKSRRQARTVACLANVRSVVTTIAAFSSSNNGKLPENRTRIEGNQHVTWRATFVQQGFIPAGKAWACPDHPGDPQSELGREMDETTCAADTPSSYALNGHVLWREGPLATQAKQSEVTIARPSHTILLAEVTTPFPDIRVTNQLVAGDYNGVGPYGYWHASKGAYGFNDGHAELIHFLDSGNPDCRWHNGKDLDQDPNFPQPPEELVQHDHPDWELLVAKVYLSRR